MLLLTILWKTDTDNHNFRWKLKSGKRRILWHALAAIYQLKSRLAAMYVKHWIADTVSQLPLAVANSMF